MMGFECKTGIYVIEKMLTEDDPYISQLEAIYLEAFPPSETIPFRTILKKFEKLKERIYYCRKENEVIAIALIAIFEDPSFLLLDYFALKKEWRGKGIGTEFLKHLFQYSNEQDPNLLLVAEVEDPEYGEKKKLKMRRIQFYQHVGMNVLQNVVYFLPPLNEKEVKYEYEINPEVFTHLKLLLVSSKSLEDFSPVIVKSIIDKLYTVHYKLKNYSALLQMILENVPNSLNFM
ncbi:GNAT family N-acetyltransferase [Candidatus Lokiarchaeum ossiferum]|uniref:GNAT family N-acetyltransferase n=1 Tax=Candidatus Lokiarchaeum ossiferum TaxID=2951803 RepID=UPI00352E0B54